LPRRRVVGGRRCVVAPWWGEGRFISVRCPRRKRAIICHYECPPRPPAVGKTDPVKFADFVGTYEVAPGQISKISTENGNLYLERKGKREQLLPEAGEIFFRRGTEGRVLFRYGGDREVDALIDRRNNEDIIWRKTR
jgi:hypothetical protein